MLLRRYHDRVEKVDCKVEHEKEAEKVKKPKKSKKDKGED